MKKDRIYLSGRISGLEPSEYKAAFSKRQRELEECGFEVVNPLNNGLPEDATTHEHMRADFALLLGCDAAYFMEGWLRSAGCKVEFDVATACGMPVYLEVPDGLGGHKACRFQ